MDATVSTETPPTAKADAYLALMDAEYYSMLLQSEDLQNHVRQRTYRKWREAVQRANMALIRDVTFHAD